MTRVVHQGGLYNCVTASKVVRDLIWQTGSDNECDLAGQTRSRNEGQPWWRSPTTILACDGSG